MKFLRSLSATIAGAILMSAPVFSQTTFPPPQVTTINGNDLIQDVVSGIEQAQSYYASAGLFGSTINAAAGDNLLIGGDGTTNLFQRATSGSSVTTTLTYGGPDRWAYWSGTNTAMTVSQDTTASDLPATGYKAGFKMARTNGQTGVVQMCMAQEIESLNVYQMQGQVAELDFNAFTGANFSAANANMTAYIITGTGTDQGLAGSSSMANGLNSGGGGSGSWTGQANATAAVISLGGVSTAGRYMAVALIPTGATEIGVALCYTPVGTAGANDYVVFTGIQLVKNPLLANLVSPTVGYNTANQPSASPFKRRNMGIETALQMRYFWNQTEPASGVTVAAGVASSTTTCDMIAALPVVMRVAPTVSFTGTALSTSTYRIQDSVTSTLASPFLAQLASNTVNALTLRATLTTATTAGFGCTLQGVAGGAVLNASAEL